VLVGLVSELRDEVALRIRRERLREADVPRIHPVVAEDPVGLVTVVHQSRLKFVLGHR
jgi:hypothetical protein